VETQRPWDLALVAGLALATVAVVLAFPWPPLRLVLGLLFVLVAPGYALVAALFPERRRVTVVRKGEDAEATEEVKEGLDAVERIALSLGLSIAVVPLAGLALNFTPWGIRLVPILATLAGFTLAACAVAAWRRARLPASERFVVAFDLSPPSWRGQSPLDKALTLGLALAVVIAGAALAYVLATPREGESFTEFYVLGPTGKAEGYPSNLSADETGRVIVGIVNREGEGVPYAARAYAERGSFVNGTGANRTFVVAETIPIAAWNATLADGEKDERNVTYAFAEPGTYRVRFDLDRPGAESPYRRLHLWVAVTG